MKSLLSCSTFVGTVEFWGGRPSFLFIAHTPIRTSTHTQSTMKSRLRALLTRSTSEAGEAGER